MAKTGRRCKRGGTMVAWMPPGADRQNVFDHQPLRAWRDPRGRSGDTGNSNRSGERLRSADAQYLFADDVLGQNRGHLPRHSKVDRNFAKEYDRLQDERVAAFSQFVADVNSKAYPEERHVADMEPAELDRFMANIDSRQGRRP